MESSCIKVRRMPELDEKKGLYLNTSVLAQRNDLQKWKDSVIWTTMDCRNSLFIIKRTFGEYVYSCKLKNTM
ncbi:MAG TPA: hypothetical protein VIY08_03030 [Candidatus Nitrosocosmicus sp.]